MKFLNALHARQVWIGTCLFTCLGMVLTTDVETFHVNDRVPRSTLGLSLLAAWLGARLFHLESSGILGQYVRGLPISAARRFRSKLLVAAAAIGVSTLVQAAYWFSSFPRGYAGWRPEHLYLPPTFEDLPVEVAWILLVFSVTAWLSNSFECRLASIQSGFVGWVLATAVLWPVAYFDAEAAGSSSAYSLLVSAFFLWGAYRAYLLKSVGAANAKEQILKSPSGTDFAFWIPSNVLLFAVPVGILYPLTWFEDLDDFLPGGAIVPALSCGVLVGVVMLPWTIRQARARALSTPRTVGLVLLSLTGWGLLVWWGARRRGPMAHCASCDRRMLAALPECPNCHSSKISHIEKQLQWGQAPAVLFFTPAIYYVLLLIIPVNLHLITTWDARLSADSPYDATLLLDGAGAREDLRGITIGAPYGTKHRGSGTRTGRARFDEASASLEVRELVTPFLEERASSKELVEMGFASPGRLLTAALPLDATFAVKTRTDDRPINVRRVTANTRARMTTHHITLEFVVVDPEVESAVARFEARLQDDAPLTDAEVDEFLSHGDPLLVALREPLPARWRVTDPDFAATTVSTRGLLFELADLSTLQLRVRYLEAMTNLVGARFKIERGASVEVVLRELDQHYAQIHDLDPTGNPSELTSELGSIERHLDLGYPWILATSALAKETPEDLAGPVREGSIPACLAAGLSARPELFDDCREAFGRAERNSSLRTAAGWAMLAIDAPRGTESLLAALEERAEAACIDLLAFSDGGTQALAFLGRQGARDDYDLAEDLGQQTRYELDSYKGKLRAARGALQSHLQPEDFLDLFELYRFYAQ